MSKRDRGFTLIELLAAMAILALVSLMAVQGLGGVLMQRDVVTRVDRRAAELARALALLRHDLEAAAPVALDPERPGDAARPAIMVRNDGFTMMRAGLATLPGAAPGAFGAVAWTLDPAGTLTRTTAGADVPMPVLRDVQALSLAALQGDLPSAEDPTTLPAGFALTLQHARFGTIRLVVAR